VADSLGGATFNVVNAPAHGTLSGTVPNLVYSSDVGFSGADSFTFSVTDSEGTAAAPATVSINVTNTAPVANDQNFSVHFGVAKSVTLAATDANSDSLSYSIVTPPAHGTLTGTAPNFVYTSATYSGPDSFTFKANDSVADSNIATVTISVTNTAPTVSASASPTSLLEGATTAFSATGSDPDGDALLYSWNFGDGLSSSASADGFSIAHTYSTAGVYSAVVTVSDPVGSTATSTPILINVFKSSALPTARFTTSDVVGFVGQPLTFDATLSTDPKNKITSYSWNFGDGSPLGINVLLSKIYDAVGTYSVSLTITNSDGLSATSTRDLVILPADQIGIFNTAIDYKVRWDRTKENADSITLSATINVGDAVIAKGTAVGFTIVGQSFSAILDGKLRNKTSTANWQITANTRKQSAGEVLLKVTIKKANLGLAFNAAGVVSNGKESKTAVAATIPLTIEIAGKTFEVEIDSTFKFSDEGKKSAGGGSM
jgi:PKD repeat protein